MKKKILLELIYDDCNGFNGTNDVSRKQMM